ncbi:MAG: phenylalanine--tRNA ligase subunit beta [Anaerolineaceae bacterium]|nr:phenylalanine--tRNA ligase subunit beta [Anaerolineaceae bacterium]
MTAQRLHSEAAYRFSRGVHPELARLGVEHGLERICQWSGGEIAAGLVDEYPQVVEDPLISLTPADVRRWLGIELTPQEISRILVRLEFECRIEGERVDVRVPPHRLDIGRGMIGMADVLEEIARIYGYENIPATRLADALPPQRSNPDLEAEDRLRDALARVGLQEVITYRLTSPEREARALPLGVPLQNAEYICLQNPIAADRCVMRRSLLPSLLETMEHNSRLRDRLAVFEIGAVYLPQPGEVLPAEPLRLGIALTGLQTLPEWDQPGRRNFDFFDLKGILEAGLESLHIPQFQAVPGEHPSFHPGKCGYIQARDQQIGVFGELHPLVKERYDIGATTVLAAELDLSALLRVVPSRFEIQPVPLFPPVLEDIAVIVDEERSAGEVMAVIAKAGGDLLAGVRLFDIYRGGQIGEAKKSLAFNLTYQAADRTLTDLEAAKVRQRIVRALEMELGAKLRS